MEHSVYKEVVIIGNGPSGISLSYILSGNWPYYSGLLSRYVPEFLHYKLCENIFHPIIQQDLSYLSEGLEGRSHNPVSLLMDTLQHPGADVGEDLASVLRWEGNPCNAVDHVVLGRGNPGGAWQSMGPRVLTLSLGSWMELPNLKLRDWCSTQREVRSTQHRADVSTIGEYYAEYVRLHNLSERFRSHFTVDSVRLHGTLWHVHAHSAANNETLRFRTPHVVLATGNSDVPNRLGVQGESNTFVMHTLVQLEEVLKIRTLWEEGCSILIVGAGLSAADAILAARSRGLSVVHVFRRETTDPQLIFKKLPSNAYPEYHQVYRLMCGDGVFQPARWIYTSYSAHTLQHIASNGDVLIESLHSHQKTKLHVNYVLILIGMHPDLSFLPDDKVGICRDKAVDCHTNPVEIDAVTYETKAYPGIYAMGPLVGDNFVRFVQGGALGISSHILQRRFQQQATKSESIDEYET